ncbi:hypothetical protein A9Q99_27485 [Gammaproteobacteria bacterium 45_16_T64]|nr:hypothetical protein A9Q99_27485 [Gammaproteobacteria bacterium 45_16_T64]
MRITLCYLLLFLPCQWAFAQNMPPQRVVVEHWPPWEIALDEKREVVSEGIAVTLVTDIMKRIDVPMELATVPWKRALAEIEQGKSALIPMIAKTAERSQYMLFTDPVFEDPLLLAYSTDNLPSFQWKTWKDLTPYTFQLVRGYAYGNEWNKALKQHRYNHSMSISDEQSLKMLMGGRIDLIPLFYVNGTQLISDLQFGDKIKFASKPLKETTFYLGISKKSPLAQRLEDMNNAIAAMKKDGTFKKILGQLYR